MRLTRTYIAKAFVKNANYKGVEQAIKELAAFLLEERMHNQAEEIILDIAKEYQNQQGIIEAEVTSAFKLSDEIKKLLNQEIKSKTGAKKVILHEQVDPSLLAGVVLRAPDMELDLTLKSKLEELKV